MSEDAKVETVNPSGPTPQIDPAVMEAMKKTAAEVVSQYMATQDKDASINLEPPVNIPQPKENPLAAVLEPVVGPAIRRAELRAMGAQEAVTFFAENPGAIPYAKDLAKAFQASLEQGTPYNYETLWAWYRGKADNFDKFVKQGIEEEKTKLQAARDASSTPGGIRPAPITKDPYLMTQEELATSLKDMPF